VAEKKLVRKEPNAISRFFRETVGELRKVNWPTRQEATNLTSIVLLVIAFMAFVLGALDLIFVELFSLLFKI
jgi:preprotein translocase subunit SecE